MLAVGVVICAFSPGIIRRDGALLVCLVVSQGC